ncbi:MAG: glycosyltransferase family 1 protein [Actinomycetota bacterium]|jgi:glycosyltransferase involved in cell wall biosynthesis
MSGPRGVVFDLQATQSVDQRHRGIPRYVADLSFAIEEIAPQAIDTYFINPDLAVPETRVTDGLLAAGKLRGSDDVDWARASLLHIASPLEMTRPGHRLLPPPARAAGVPYVVTFYDLIPQLMPEYYLEDPGLRRRYRARLQLVRNAAGILTLSEATRADVVEHLALDAERVFVVGAGTSSRFVPPASREAAAAAATAAVPGLRAPYVFYIGSYERRKNLEPLLEAWALVPPAVRARWQLALCCPLKPLERNHLLHRAAGLGVADSVCLTGFVTDDVLLLLHQGTDLFVFPSIYEGYGLPVAEALACGAPVLAANSSSLPEILGPEALFDATSPPPMAAAIERGLTDAQLRERLLAAAGKPPNLWTDVAAATVAAYEQVVTRLGEERRWSLPSRGDRRRRVGFVGPLGPDGGPVGEWNQSFLERLTRHDDLDVRVFAERRAGLGGPYDDVVYSLADDEHHASTLAALRRRRNGIVVAHDAYLSDLYVNAAGTGHLPGGLEAAVTAAYGDAVLPGTGRSNRLDAAEARRLGVLLARDAVHASRTFLGTSEQVAALARLDAQREDRHKVVCIPADPAGAADAVRAAVDGGLSSVAGRRPARPEGPVFFDLQALQSVDQRHRGIARYVLDLALALEETAPRYVGAYLVNPDLALPEAAERFVATGKVRASDEVDWSAARILHTGSLFEMGTHLDRLLPPAALAAGVAWTVTFHDLIPWLMPESYLEDPGRRRRYRARLQLLRTADAVLTNSKATRADAIEHLGLDPDRVLVAGTGTGRQFVPPRSRPEAAAAAARAVPGLRPPFVFYVGSYDRRKNLEPFLEAWSRLDPDVRARYSLVVSAIPDRLERNHLLHRAAQLGITEGLCVTGFLPDDVLLLLLQGTDLFVFPSLYEGYGLPVAEALACGAAVLAADTSSLPEIVGPDALFDAGDPGRMAEAITRGLTDQSFRSRLLANAGRPPSTWADVAAATVAAYDRILERDTRLRRRPRRSPRLRLAVVAALPPDGGPRAPANRQLLEALTGRPDVEVHAFADRPSTAGRDARTPDVPAAVTVHPLGSLEAVERCDGPFDGVVYVIADDEHHCGSLAALRRRRDGVVVSHDAYLSNLYGHAERSGALHEGIGRVVRASYGDLVTSGFNPDRPLPAGEARRLGILFCRDAVAHARRFVVASRISGLVRLDAVHAGREKVVVADGAAAVADVIYRFFGDAAPVDDAASASA